MLSMNPLISLRQQLGRQQQRRLVIISGSQNWCQQQLQGVFEPEEKVFKVTGNETRPATTTDENHSEATPYEVMASNRLGYHLGQEIDGAIIDVHDGLAADTLGIVSGMIKAGGLLLLLAPPIDEWQLLPNPEDARFLNTPFRPHQAQRFFTQHLINHWLTDEVVWLTEQQAPRFSSPPQTPLNAPPNPTRLPTPDQQAALDKIHSVAFGHRKRPLVISADRGRGKTTALGLAAMECLRQGKQHIVLTASRSDQVQAAFQHARHALQRIDGANAIGQVIDKPQLLEFDYQGERKRLQFLAPDHLVMEPTTADLLMVDEAAQLPTPLLTALLQRHHRIVFSTTLHGYEGAGRGFELRFKQQLDQYTPDWKSIHLDTPVRWAPQDPLEIAISEALLLNAQLDDIDDLAPDVLQAQPDFRVVTQKQLMDEPDTLKSLFALLVQAHYQTSPNDLQQMLNAPNLHIIIAEYPQALKPRMVGAVLCIEEGKLNPSQMRAHGHLVPQLLTRHYAQADFIMLSTLRVMRIAVHPALQRHGIGRGLIQQVEKLGQQKQVDYICSSFGASDELLPFWFLQYYWPLHVGVKRDKASGSHNLVVAKPLSAMSRQALSQIQSGFQNQFPHLLFESLPHLPAPQILHILQTFRFRKHNPKLEQALVYYANNVRPYESISGQLWEWSLQSAHRILQTSWQDQAIWCDKVLKKQHWQEVAHRHHLSGRKEVEKRLKAMIIRWVQQPANTQGLSTLLSIASGQAHEP